MAAGSRDRQGRSQRNNGTSCRTRVIVTLLRRGSQLTKSITRCQLIDASVTQTIQCGAWTNCSARRRRPKRAISGSVASVSSSRRCFARAARAGRRRDPRLRLRTGRQRRAARPLRPRVRIRPDGRRAASAAQPDERRLAGRRSPPCRSQRRVRHRHVVRRALLARNARRARGGVRDVSRPEARRLPRRQRRGDGRRCAAIIRCSATRSGATAGEPRCGLLDRRRVRDRAHHLHERHRCSCRWLIARALQRWRGLSPERRRPKPGDHACRRRRSTWPLTAALWLESLWLRVVDNPFGSSLLCLARKPA